MYRDAPRLRGAVRHRVVAPAALALTIALAASTWSNAYRQPVVLFCAANGTWARYEPAASLLGSNFASVDVIIPPGVTPGGGFSYSPGEVHANPDTPNNVSLLIDDFRHLAP